MEILFACTLSCCFIQSSAFACSLSVALTERFAFLAAVFVLLLLCSCCYILSMFCQAELQDCDYAPRLLWSIEVPIGAGLLYEDIAVNPDSIKCPSIRSPSSTHVLAHKTLFTSTRQTNSGVAFFCRALWLLPQAFACFYISMFCWSCLTWEWYVAV